MECYYIVISSTHLSNGHFRNIKGVFRGPLSKNGNKTLDYAEKENTIAKALEDLKANFYCELCDKQYYKHQEFDNHINSYDHAHKQRLKELKQREFARNVASKSRKDERKQEKALQRLHKLAELRKETVCAPGSGPMFKSTTVTVRENCNEISQRAVVDSVNNQEDFKYTLIHSEENAKNVTTVAAGPESANNYTKNNHTKNNQLGDQAQGIHRHKVGFSFAFPKKASLKLESSAAAFCEHNDEASVEKGLSRKSRFVPGACHLQLSSPTDVLLSLEEKANSFHLPEGMCTYKEATQTQEMKDVSSEKDTLLLPSFCPFQLPLSSDADSCQNSVPLADRLPLEDVINEDVPMSGNSSELLGNKCTVLDRANDCMSLQATLEENAKNNDACTSEAENKSYGPERLAPSNSEEENITLHKKMDFYKRPCEPFAPVLNKDGSTVLQWPSEMLIYTATQPSISYSCNPLCFDFKSTKLNNNLDKNKLPLNGLYSQQKGEDICKRPVLDGKDRSIAGLTDDDIGGSRNASTQVTPLLAEDTLSNSCDSERSDSMGQRYKSISCRIRKTKGYNFIKKQIKHDIHEKYNKTRLKDTHEHWFHKSRRKKRRKLCHHHHGEKTKESKTHFKMETENSCTATSKKNLLETISEKQDLAVEQLLDSHQLPDKKPKSTFIYLSENEEMCKTWNTEYNNNNDISSKNQCTKNSVDLNEQSNPTMTHSEKHCLAYSRTYCSCKAKMSSCSQDHRCLVLQNDIKCMHQNHAVKRGYNSLINESEIFYRKRRQHSYSYSSDESLNRQNYLSEEFWGPPHASAPFKPKRKRRRKRNGFHTRLEALELKENTDYSMKGNSACHQGELTNEGKKEEIKPQENANVERNLEQTDQVENKLTLHPSSPLPSRTNGENEHLVMGTTSAALPEISSEPTTSVYVASAPPKEEINKTLLEHKAKTNININEKQIPSKVPNVEKNCRQSQPKSFLCHYELAEALPQGKVNEASPEWLRFNSGILNAQPPLPFKEAHVSGHTFVTTEHILAPLALPEQALLIPIENHDKFKNLPCEVYQHIIPPNMLASKVKFAFPPAALAPPSTALQPLPLQQPLCSTSVTAIRHTAAPAAAAGTFKVLQPHHQFLAQVPALTRTSLPQISIGPVGPRLCPGNQPTFVAPPQMPIIPASVLHPSHLTFPPLPHALFPSLLSPHPSVIPLQPLF